MNLGGADLLSTMCVLVCVQQLSSPETEKWRKQTIGLIQGLEFFQVMSQKQWSKGSEDIAQGWLRWFILTD